MSKTAHNQVDQAEKPRKKRGRKPVLTIEKIDKVCQYLMMGHYMKDALSLCGIKERTWYKNVERAEAAKRPTALQKHLMQSIAKAEAQFINYHLSIVNAAKDPKVSMEFLARRHPDKFASSTKNLNRQVNKDGDDVPAAGVLMVPGPVDETEWQEMADRYKDFQPKTKPDDDDADDL